MNNAITNYKKKHNFQKIKTKGLWNYPKLLSYFVNFRLKKM